MLLRLNLNNTVIETQSQYGSLVFGGKEVNLTTRKKEKEIVL